MADNRSHNAVTAANKANGAFFRWNHSCIDIAKERVQVTMVLLFLGSDGMTWGNV